jgi:hypothetical protein
MEVEVDEVGVWVYTWILGVEVFDAIPQSYKSTPHTID